MATTTQADRPGRRHRAPRWAGCALALSIGVMGSLMTSSSAEAAVCLPLNDNSQQYWALNHWYSPGRGDNFTSSDPRWEGCRRGDGSAWGATKSPDYSWLGYDGLIFSPNRSRPAGTVPLRSWWDPNRGDNFATTDPRWQPAGPYDIHRGPAYTYYRLEGYVYDPARPQPAGTIPIYNYWNPATGDNELSTFRRLKSDGSPAYYRLEGYVLYYPYNPYARR